MYGLNEGMGRNAHIYLSLVEVTIIMNNKSYLSAQDIIDSFLKYLNNTIYSYAYMLDGSWGSGKTFFVKEKLIPAIEKQEKKKRESNPEYKEKRVLYVSLYGIKDTEEISRLLYLELRRITADDLTKGKTPEFLENHKSKITSWIGTGAKIVADVVKDSKGIDIEGIFNKISSGFSLENCIFIFDDLERTSCNINDILGYINNFIEHDGIKVLLIANEEEINTVSQLDTNPEELLVCLQENLDFDFLEPVEEKNPYQCNTQNGTNPQKKLSLDKLMKRVEVLFARNQAYKQIKEKVVGETVKYQPVYIDMIKDLTEKHLSDNEELRNIILKKAEKISEIALHYQHLNLRTYLFFLSKMVTIYDCLKEHVQTIEKMVEYTFLISVKCKTGIKIEEWKESSLFDCRSLYGWLDFRNRCLAFKFVDDFVLYGKIDSKEVIDTVTLYELFERKNAEDVNDPAKRIQNWWSMEEKTLQELMEEVLIKMEDNGYSFNAYLHILNNFVSLTSIGFNESYLNRLMKYMKNNIRNTSEIVELQRWHSSFAGDKDRELYALKKKELNDEVVAKNNSHHKETLSDMFSDITSWGAKVSAYVSANRNRVDNSFISQIDPYRVLTVIEESNTENVEAFRYAIGDIYSFSNIADFYMDDYTNLKIIHDGLNPSNPNYDLVKKKNVEWLKELIAEKMKALKPDSEASIQNGLAEDKNISNDESVDA